MTTENQLDPAVLPLTGMSRFSQFKQYLPFSKEKFRQLSLIGKAPKPIRLGIRCTFYQNKELHRFLENPLEYRINLEEATHD